MSLLLQDWVFIFVQYKAFLYWRIIMTKQLFSLLFPLFFLLISNVAFSANLSTQLQISALSENLYLVKSFKEIVNSYEGEKPMLIDANSLIYVDNKDAYLIDTPWNETDMPVLMAWIDKQGLTLKRQ